MSSKKHEYILRIYILANVKAGIRIVYLKFISQNFLKIKFVKKKELYNKQCR